MNDNDWMHADMTGWNVLITGGNSGIGYAYARIAVNNNANVTIACRNENHARTACMVLNGLNEDNKVDYLIMDDSTGGYWYDDMTVWHADNLHASQELTC